MISEERYQTSYHVRRLKNGKDWLFLFDTWSTYLEKLQFILAETCQITNLRSQDVSQKILSDLVNKNVAEFSYKFSHFQYTKQAEISVVFSYLPQLLLLSNIFFLWKVNWKILSSTFCTRQVMVSCSATSSVVGYCP